LYGALLAARLFQKVADRLHIEKEVFYAWSDARVVLAWIKAHPSKWITFVANQVAAIQEIVPEDLALRNKTQQISLQEHTASDGYMERSWPEGVYCPKRNLTIAADVG